jgi:uncharacterized protein (TIGR03435 family)
MTCKPPSLAHHCALLVIAAACFTLTQSTTAQNNPTATNSANSADSANSASFSYDVVSIRPHAQSDGSIMSRVIDNGFSQHDTILMVLVLEAYDLTTPDQIVGLPSWADSDRFDVEAKMDEQILAALQKLPREQRWQTKRQMLQDVLADRFKLKVHKETREMTIYNLVIAKGGLKMKQPPDGKPTGYRVGRAEISGDGIAFAALVAQLPGEVHGIVQDKTGLTGYYSIHLKWNPNPLSASAGPAGAPNTDDALPDLFSALQDQLGLKLESTKAPVDVIVIDHVEKPSEN